MPTNRFWTKEEVLAVKKHYKQYEFSANMQLCDLEKEINRSISAIVCKAKELGLSKRNRLSYRYIKDRWAIDEITGCWNWLLSLNSKGYANERNDNGVLGHAHIHNYENKYGKVPTGKELDHLCRNPKCVNPDHLEPVTRAINIQRGNVAVITIEIAREIRRRKKETPTLTDRKMGTIFKVSHSLISQVLNNKTWKETT